MGVGNPILGDDGVGIYVAKKVEALVGQKPGLHVKTASTGGLRLLEEMFGYDRVILVDGIVSDGNVGRTRKLSPADFSDTLHYSSAHDLNFATALEMGESISPDEMPSQIEIYTVEIQRTTMFSEGLSPAVKEAADRLSQEISESLKQQ